MLLLGLALLVVNVEKRLFVERASLSNNIMHILCWHRSVYGVSFGFFVFYFFSFIYFNRHVHVAHRSNFTLHSTVYIYNNRNKANKMEKIRKKDQIMEIRRAHKPI